MCNGGAQYGQGCNAAGNRHTGVGLVLLVEGWLCSRFGTCTVLLFGLTACKRLSLMRLPQETHEMQLLRDRLRCCARYLLIFRSIILKKGGGASWPRARRATRAKTTCWGRSAGCCTAALGGEDQRVRASPGLLMVPGTKCMCRALGFSARQDGRYQDGYASRTNLISL